MSTMDDSKTRESYRGRDETKLQVLLIEDNPGDARLIEEHLSEAKHSSFSMSTATTLYEGLTKLDTGYFDLILLDLSLPDSYGFATVEKTFAHAKRTPIVVLTGLADEGEGLESLKVGAQDYLIKDKISADTIERAIRYAIERKRVAEALMESDERYVSIFQNSAEPMLLIDINTGRILDANPAACRTYGYTREEMSSMNIADINALGPENAPPFMSKAAARGEAHFAFKHRLKNGDLIDVEAYSSPIQAEGRTVLFSIIHDITEKVRAEQEREALIKENDEHRLLFQTVIDNAPAGIVVLNGEDLTIKWVNAALLSSFDKTPSVKDFRGLMVKDLLSANDELIKAIENVARTKEPYLNPELERTDASVGSTYWNASVVPLKRGGTSTDLVVMMVDTTEQVYARKRMEEMAARVDEEKRRLKTIFDTLPVGIMVVDTASKVIQTNDMLDTIWGGRAPWCSSIEDFRDFKAWWADTGIPMRAGDWGIVRAVTKGETSIGEAIDVQRFDGTRGTILSSAAAIKDAMGKVIGAVSVIQDITRQRRLEHDAIEAKEQAQLYLDLLAHDINNMNAAVVGYLQLALETMDIEGKNKALFTKPLEVLENSSRLIDNVRKIQQVESHESKHGLIDVGWLLEDVRTEYEAFPGREVKIEYKTQIKRYVMASELLKDVFSNIVGNAIKHSSGPINISISLNKIFEDGREYFKIMIEDDGPGIPDELKSKLFQRKQIGRTKTSGSGLGLYLVRKLVEDFNGRVWIEDRVPGESKKGARFVVMLPAAMTWDHQPRF